jgi:hypothetical protein
MSTQYVKRLISVVTTIVVIILGIRIMTIQIHAQNWVMVEDGTTLVNGGFGAMNVPSTTASPNFPSNINAFIARNSPTYLSNVDFGSNPARLSNIPMYAGGYSSNVNINQQTSSLFDTYLNRSADLDSVEKFTFGTTTIPRDEKISEVLNLPKSDYTIVEINGDLVLAGNNTCDAKITFFVRGTITIYPELDTNSIFNGCVFFAEGNVTLQSLRNTQFETIQAFIVSQGTVRLATGNTNTSSIDFQGSIIANRLDITKSIGTNWTNRPQIYMTYDARYKFLMQPIFADISYSLRENID